MNANGTPIRTDFRPSEFKKMRDQLAETDVAIKVITASKDLENPTVQKLFDLVVAQQGILTSLLDLLLRNANDDVNGDKTMETDETNVETEADIKEKRRSLVISGLPESTAAIPSDRSKADRDEVVKLMDAIDAEVTPMQVYRLPRSQDYKGKQPRLLKVVLATSYQQKNALIKSKELKKNLDYGNVFIRPSMNREERQLDFELRQAVKKLKDRGEVRVHIKRYKLFVGEVEYDKVSLEPLNH